MAQIVAVTFVFLLFLAERRRRRRKGERENKNSSGGRGESGLSRDSPGEMQIRMFRGPNSGGEKQTRGEEEGWLPGTRTVFAVWTSRSRRHAVATEETYFDSFTPREQRLFLPPELLTPVREINENRL